MDVKKSLIGVLMCFGISTIGIAQSAHWAIPPKFQSITPFAPNLFKIKTATNVGICDIQENWIMPLSMDSITYVVNGYALAMTKSGNNQYRIKYVIKDNGTYEAVKEELYIGDNPYFSENRCPVVNKKGKYGYIDSSGKLVVPCNYTKVQPYRNGVAIVSKDKAGFLSKDKGGFLNLTKIYEIDRLGKERAIKDASMANWDTEMMNIGDLESPYVAPPDDAYQRFLENKQYGYNKNGKLVLPAQFDEGGQVIDDCAIVMTDYLYGVIKFNSAKIDCKVNESTGTLKVETTIPSVWENHTAIFCRIVNDASRTDFELQGSGIQRTLSASVTNENGKIVYELVCDKLVLWRGSSENSVPKENPSDSKKSGNGGGLSVSVPSVVEAKNAKNVCEIPISVVNHGVTTRTINISLSTGQRSSIKLSAGKSGTVTVNVPVTKKTVCKITAVSGKSSSVCSTTLKPKIVL